MGERVIIRSSVPDRHGDGTPVELLMEHVTIVNSDQKMRFLANHRRDLPPIGYFTNAELLQAEDIYHVTVEQVNFCNQSVANWNENLLIEDCGTHISFISRNEITPQMKIKADKNNFKSLATWNRIGVKLSSFYEEPIITETSMRKTLLLDPQIAITLAGYYSIIYPMLKPFLKRIGEKLADDIADDLYDSTKEKAKKLIGNIANSINFMHAGMVPTKRVLHTIFEIPGEIYIELHIRSNDSNRIFKALSSAKLSKIHMQISDLQLNIEVSEIYFVYNKKDKWEFTYLISKSGQIVGTKSTFETRDKLVKRISLSPTKGFSVGADGVKYEER